MATKKQKHTFVDRADELSQQLQTMESVIRLCAFAAEARRVLVDIDYVLDRLPDIGAKMSTLVDSRNEWTTHEDALPLVLRDIAHQVNAAHARLNDPEVRRDINNP